MAGGAALAGLAGGVALGAKRYSGRKVLGMRVGNGSGKAGKSLAEASKNVARLSENIGESQPRYARRGKQSKLGPSTARRSR